MGHQVLYLLFADYELAALKERRGGNGVCVPTQTYEMDGGGDRGELVRGEFLVGGLSSGGGFGVGGTFSSIIPVSSPGSIPKVCYVMELCDKDYICLVSPFLGCFTDSDCSNI